MQASDRAFLSGSTVTCAAGIPKIDNPIATFASLPPNVASKRGVCIRRSMPGAASLNISSPNVTTVFTAVVFLMAAPYA